jgi:HEAT repeat protein
MRAVMPSPSRNPVPLVVSAAVRAFVLLVPTALLLIGMPRTSGASQIMLLIGAAFQGVVCFLAFLSSRSWRQPVAPSVISLYLIALGWLWLGGSPLDDWYHHFAQAVLLIVPLTVFAFQILINSGAPAIRRARVLSDNLARRRDLPTELSTCRNLPEVKALREALHLDATPALNLLSHPQLGVRVAALATLEFRKNWRRGQAELVLHVAQKAQEPVMRIAAMNALANLDERILVEAVAQFLQDPCREVREAATEALLWNCEQRWSWIRHVVRAALSNPDFQQDGPLQCSGQLLSAEAVADLNAWASEMGILGVRAIHSLGVHHNRVLQDQPEAELLAELRRQLTDPHAPPLLRLEVARALRAGGWLDNTVQERLLDSANPALLRLQAAEALLDSGPHPRALATIYDVARLPNREIALATAAIVQRCLNVDLGLPIGQPLPPVNSRHAAEVTRRVMSWAAQVENEPASGVMGQQQPVASGQ